jgi:serine/threonine protein kinase/tetratricopeptide (TPR) repeat protein
MTVAPALDEELLGRLPLPLAQLYRRAHNAKTPQERHHTAYYLWEASLKLLASVAIVEYAELGDANAELAERLHNLARPALGHWWEFVRRLLPVLADRGDPGFGPVRELVLGRSRDDLPHAAGLDAVLLQVLEGRESAGSRTTVRLTELFDRLVRYRNREFGHGATGQKPAAFYDRVGRALLAALPELLARLDSLAGRRLLYVADVRRQSSGRWLVERYELRGEVPRRLESLDLPDGESMRQLVPDRLFLESLIAPGAAAVVSGERAEQGLRAVCLHPLLVYEAEAGEALFLNARRGRLGIEYLSYTTGRELERTSLAHEQSELLARVLHLAVDAPSVAEWAVRSQAEEQEQAGGEPEGEGGPGPAPPRRMGEFELLSELGRGGMGVVYRAWQPSLGRQVAVKALYRTGDLKAEARFAREIRALGRVEHPHLVKIFMSGSEGDQWFYAMELVEGATLAAVCEELQGRSSRPETVDYQAWQEAVSSVSDAARRAEKPLSASVGGSGPPPPAAASGHEPDAPHPALRVGHSYVRQAVELVRQAAVAAHALHERGILHRDIKPGNIMVTADGHEAVLMDLGLAQIADEVAGRLTRTRQFIGTLRYASPEQVLAVGGLDRRSDIYNLGATLWELITLQPMFEANDQTPTPDLMRRIQLEEPQRPRKYHPGLSRDLEAIVLKCLEKQPERRYSTARELVRDLERYQAGEPVRARPVGSLQRSWRWCRRNPAISGMLAALVVVIVGSLAGLTSLYLNAERQRQVAVHREAQERALSKFYEDHVLAAARPENSAGGGGKDVTLRDALDQAALKIGEAFAGEPELEASVRHTLGRTYWYLGKLDAANPHLEKAYAIRLKELGPDHPDTLESLHDLAMERWKQEKLKEAITMGRQALEGRRRVLGPEHKDTLFAQLNLGLFLSEDDQLDEAEALLRAAIAACKRTLGPDHHHTLYGQNDLAVLLNNRGKFEEALALDRQTLEGRRRSLGPDHPDTLRSIGNLACTLWNVDRLQEAEAMCRQGLEARRRVLGDAHEETFWSLRNLAGILEAEGKPAEAEALRRQMLEDSKRLRGPDDPETLTNLSILAQHLSREGKFAESEQLFRQLINTNRRKFGPEDRNTLWSLGHLATVLGDQGRWAETERIYREVLGIQRRVRGPEHPDTLVSLHNVAWSLEKQHKPAESEKLYRQTLEIERRVLGSESPSMLTTQTNLARVLADLGRLDEAEKLYRQALDIERRARGPENSSALVIKEDLADFLEEHGRLKEAEVLLQDVWSVRQKTLDKDHPALAASLVSLGKVRTKMGRCTEAEGLLREALAIREKKLLPGDWLIASARSVLGDCLARQKRFDEAEPHLLAGYEGLARATDAPPKRVAEALDRVIALYVTWGKSDQAEAWRKKQVATRVQKP